ncbi:MAG TPA: LD-carboxypeptidase [Streptosporangiaceae bacterium]|nr:LD-carboxypeptidase [Streptosporangiaceae bacterium]
MDVLKPRALRPGDTIGIVSTSSPVSPAALDRLTGYLRGRGYQVKLADGVTDRLGHFAGTPERRAAGVMAMFADPEVAMVLPANGGTGSHQLIDRLDYDLIRAHPKLFAGFSNPSALNNSMLAAAGLATLHGVTGFQFFQPEIEPGTERAFWSMVSGPVAGTEISGRDWRVHRRGSPGGIVSGPVVGGNLGACFPLVGTPWMPSTAGAILVVEARSATYEVVDAFLTQLRLAGLLDGIAALVIGAPADWAADGAPDRDVDELILRAAPGPFPIVTNLPCGHQPRRIQLPVGCRVGLNLDGEVPVIRYEEDLVRR